MNTQDLCTDQADSIRDLAQELFGEDVKVLAASCSSGTFEAGVFSQPRATSQNMKAAAKGIVLCSEGNQNCTVIDVDFIPSRDELSMELIYACSAPQSCQLSAAQTGIRVWVNGIGLEAHQLQPMTSDTPGIRLIVKADVLRKTVNSIRIGLYDGPVSALLCHLSTETDADPTMPKARLLISPDERAA